MSFLAHPLFDNVWVTVQIEALANNFAKMLMRDDASTDYGNTFRYVKPYFTMYKERPAQVEEMLSGVSSSNTGEVDVVPYPGSRDNVV